MCKKIKFDSHKYPETRAMLWLSFAKDENHINPWTNVTFLFEARAIELG